ncbi:MAG: dihydroorotase [Sulfuricella sp.]|nr:dihydroorotase [Sulfuricella sp.]
MKIHIKNGYLVDPKNGVDGQFDIFVAAGKVVSFGKEPDGFQANRIIDATGLTVCPGLIDLSARLREPGYEYMATLESEMAAAVAGGITTLVCPPDTDPPLDEPGLVEMLKYRAKSLNQARVFPLGALTQKLEGARITEMAELRDAGCIGFSQADAPLVDTQVLWRAMQYAATFDFTVWLRPQDAHLAKGGVAHDGEVASRLGLAGIPASAESVAMATILTLVRETGARVHFCRLSTRTGVEMLRAAKADGLPVTADISVHAAHLCEMDIGFFDANCHLIPPLRSQRDRDGLRQGLADGTVDAVCSDHAPVDDDAKFLPFAEAEPGATGLELLLPLTLKWAREMNLPLSTAIAKITAAPACVLGLNAGNLAPGQPADLTLFDPDQYWKIEPHALKSQGKNTPFSGVELQGKVRMTLVEGHVVYESV